MAVRKKKTTLKDYESVNKISYNKNLRQKLEEAHKFLGLEVTDVIDASTGDREDFIRSAQNVLKMMSKFASDLSVALFEAGKGHLNWKEAVEADKVGKIAEMLGNLQFELNKVIKYAEEQGAETAKIIEMISDFGSSVMKAQEEFRSVRASMNALGYLSDNPRLAYLFKGE